MTPRDASITDPQHRIFLELAWDALEHAGYDPGRYPGTSASMPAADRAAISCTICCPIALRSPTSPSCACRWATIQPIWPRAYRTSSTSRVPASQSAPRARHRWSPSTWPATRCATIQCDIALAGGISVQFPQVRGYLYETDSILSPDGHCRAFDARAQGTVSGNGGGRRGAEAACRCAEGERHDLRRDPRQRRQQRWRGEVRLHRAEHARTDAGDLRGAGGGGGDGRYHRLCRDPRHRHATRRSDRVRGADAGVPPADRRATSFARSAR